MLSVDVFLSVLLQSLLFGDIGVKFRVETCIDSSNGYTFCYFWSNFIKNHLKSFAFYYFLMHLLFELTNVIGKDLSLRTYNFLPLQRIVLYR